jgi:hypothetical protein
MVKRRKATSDGRGLRLRVSERAILNEAAGWLYVAADLHRQLLANDSVRRATCSATNAASSPTPPISDELSRC